MESVTDNKSRGGPLTLALAAAAVTLSIHDVADLVGQLFLTRIS